MAQVRQNSPLLIQGKGPNFHFDAFKAFLDAYFGLFTEVASVSHPQKAVDGHTCFTSGKWRIK